MSLQNPTLSGSTDGQPIQITASGSPGDLIHTAWNSGTVVDYLTLQVINEHTASGTLTLEWGGVDPNQHAENYNGFGVQGDGAYLVTWKKPISDGLEVRAYVSEPIAAVSGCRLWGDVIRASKDDA